MTPPVLVTGATGNVGKTVVEALVRRGIPVRAAVFRSRRGLPVGVPTTTLDFSAPDTYAQAVTGAGALFLLRPPPISNVKDTLNVLVDSACAAGVTHVVFLSVLGADRKQYIPHYAVERHLERVGVRYTFLRAGFFAQNLEDAYRDDILEHDRIYVPAGRGRVSFVDVRDIGEVAALAFAAPDQHAGQAYTLTGPQALSFDDVAQLLTGVLGRSIRYEPATLIGYVRHLRRKDTPWAQAMVQLLLHAGLRFGQGECADTTLERLLGRPATPMVRYLTDHQTCWAKRV